MAEGGIAGVPRGAAPAGRNAGLDGMRAALTLLVVFHHAAITYGAQGGWFYREVAPDGSPSSLLLTVFCAVNQAWFMGAFFLLAGYFSPGALAPHGTAGFLRERLVRLGLPLLAFVLVIGPATVALARTAQGRPFLETLAALAREAAFIPGPMWFVQALLLFSLGAVALRALARHRDAPAAPLPFPSNLALAVAALLTGVAAFLLRLAWPVGTAVAGMQPGYFASYVVLFAAGWLGAAGGWLEEVPAERARRWLLVALATIPVLPLALLAASVVPAMRGASAAGGWTVPAAFYALWEPFVAWGLILAVLAVAPRYLAALPAALVRRAYAIYLIHPPVLVGISLLLRGLPAPALLKFPVSGTLACLACFVIAGLLLRIPPVARVL